LAEEFASGDLELHWLDEDKDAPEALFESRLKVGAVTLNEMRDALGLDPYDNAAADRPMVLTATGYVPIEANAGGEGEGDSISTDKALAAKARDVGLHRRDPIYDCLANDLSTVLRKSGYDPAEPRVPKRNVGGGEWTRVAANDDPNETSDGPLIPRQPYAVGHHWVTRKIFEKRKFSDEVKTFFDKARSGPLADPSVNHNTKEHRAYNDAVDELLDDFLKKNNITEEQMTLAQADEFVQAVKIQPTL
jgi:hypothetical protein